MRERDGREREHSTAQYERICVNKFEFERLNACIAAGTSAALLKDVAPEGVTRTRERNDEEEIRKTPGGSGSGSATVVTPAVIKRDGKMANNNDAAGSVGYLPAEISRELNEIRGT